MATELTIQYYKFSDPGTKADTKDIGWTAINDFVSKKATYNADTKEWVVLSQETVKQTYIVKPKEEKVSLISQDEYNKLDTSKESLRIKKRRERNEAQLQDLQGRLGK